MHVGDFSSPTHLRQGKGSSAARMPQFMGCPSPRKRLGSGSEAKPAAPELSEGKAESRGILELGEHVTVDMELDAATVQTLKRGCVLRNLERPDRAEFDPSSAVHDRLERNAQNPTPGADVVPHFRGLEMSLTHGFTMPQAEPDRWVDCGSDGRP